MEKLLYNIDFDKIKRDSEHIYWIEGWVLGPDDSALTLTIRTGEGKSIPGKIESRNRPDVKEALGDIAPDSNLGFSVYLDISEDIFQYADLQIWVEGKDINKQIFKKSIIDILNLYEKENLKLKVEKMLVTEDYYVVAGWVLDGYGTSKIYLEDRRGNIVNFQVEKNPRWDIVEAFHILDSKRAYGFTIRIEKNEITGNKINICLIEKTFVLKERLNLKHLLLAQIAENVKKKYREFKKLPRTISFIYRFGKQRYSVKQYRKKSPKYKSYLEWFEEHVVTDRELSHQKKKSHKVKIELLLINANEEEIEDCVKIAYQGQSYQNFILPSEMKSKSWTELEAESIMTSSVHWYLLSSSENMPEPDLIYQLMQLARHRSDLEVIYTDHDEIHQGNYYNPSFKSDYNLELLRCWNYIGDCFMVKSSLLKSILTNPKTKKISDFHDLLLKLTERTDKIGHLSHPLYHKIENTKNDNIKKVNHSEIIADHLQRSNISAVVGQTQYSGISRIFYTLDDNPLISVLILNKDHKQDLEKCLNSIFSKTNYKNYEILIGENNSESDEIFIYYKKIQERYSNVRVLTWKKEFNYSAINNMLAKEAKGSYLVLLNNDIEVITGDWLNEMLSYCQRPDIGIVGAKLYYPDDTIQHAGVVLGLGGIAGHILTKTNREDTGYMMRLVTVQEVSIVTAAALMISRDAYYAVNGLDENLKVAFNDSDLCMKIRKSGLKVIFNPNVELYHYESKSRGSEDTPEKIRRFGNEVTLFRKRWKEELKLGDPYYNSNLTLKREDCFLKDYDEEENDGRSDW